MELLFVKRSSHRSTVPVIIPCPGPGDSVGLVIFMDYLYRLMEPSHLINSESINVKS